MPLVHDLPLLLLRLLMLCVLLLCVLLLLLLLVMMVVIGQRGRCTVRTHTILGAAIVLLTMPLGHRATHVALGAVVPEIRGHPGTLAKAVPEAMEPVFGSGVPQRATKKLEFKALSLVLGLLGLATTRLFPFSLPLAKRLGVFADLRPRFIIG